MVHCSNHCKSNLNASGSSSSEFVDHCLYKRCNPTCCLDQCEFISDRNYKILRKICTKIFKEYNRAKCREKYTIFDGGNSINVRIHRSDTRGDETYRHEKSSEENRYKLQSQHGYLASHLNKGEKQTVLKPGRAGEKIGFEGYERDVNEKKPNKNPKYKSKTGSYYGNESDENYKENKTSGKQKLQNQNSYFNKGDKQTTKKSGRAGDKLGSAADETDINSKKNRKLQMGYNDDEANRRYKSKGVSYNDNESLLDYKDKTITGKQKSRKRVSSEMAKSKSRKTKNSYNEDTTDNIDENNAKKVKNKTEKSRGNKSHKGSLDNSEIGGTKNKRKLLSTELNINKKYNIVSNLRSKVRRGEKINFDAELGTMKKSKPQTYQAQKFRQYKKIKPSRADEVKTCDYLRAQMEERELCKLCCVQQTCQCVPCTCIPTYCPKTVIPCYLEACKC